MSTNVHERETLPQFPDDPPSVPTFPARFSVHVERGPDGWYVATLPELPGCHTQGSSPAQALERIAEAIGLYAWK